MIYGWYGFMYDIDSMDLHGFFKIKDTKIKFFLESNKLENLIHGFATIKISFFKWSNEDSAKIGPFY